MKRLVTLGLTLFFTFILSSTVFASSVDSRQIKRIINIQPLLDQELVIGNLKELIPTSNDGSYQYYKLGSMSKKTIRSLSKNDRTEVEIQNNHGEWELAQIRFDKTGVTANYKNGSLLGYTRKLGDDILAHYMDRNEAETDPTGQNADFYTKFTDDGLYTCYCDTLDNARKGTANLRIFSGGNSYRVETRNSEKWNLVMLVHPEKGMIANYKDHHFSGMSKIYPNGSLAVVDNELARL